MTFISEKDSVEYVKSDSVKSPSKRGKLVKGTKSAVWLFYQYFDEFKYFQKAIYLRYRHEQIDTDHSVEILHSHQRQ